jgi:hypothetical protein
MLPEKTPHLVVAVAAAAAAAAAAETQARAVAIADGSWCNRCLVQPRQGCRQWRS